jgi:hypothetical protein
MQIILSKNGLGYKFPHIPLVTLILKTHFDIFTCDDSFNRVHIHGDQIGQILPFGHEFTLDNLGTENYKSCTDFFSTFFHVKSSVLILTKTGWATFWSIYFANSSGSHLITYPDEIFS